ncbi:glutathione S-transferase N-terminal domain-containing protein [Rhodobacter sp. Har01]|uniref:glutathione S-transferase family protein n=1 Tax=Rhodobacter sp. Har01 TaxID=2883999 RepID=UPI001D081F15|nr:glutathione S-transferase N-terminal domain-containing protein [Rhodobacter sp. Har01]MCB6178853.1 glutathione S-transferase N-terminal domain-containing protein [Rhodobacter sp. Har01]
MLALHSAPDSAATIVRLVCAAARIELALRAVGRAPDALESQAFRALNPTGTIPVLETPQGPVSETGATLLWLSDAHRLGPGPADAGRPAFLKWLFFLSNTVHADLRQLVRPWRYAPVEAEAGQVNLAAGRFLAALGLVDQALRQQPALFPQLGPLSCYLLMLCRWAAQYPLDHPRWFHLTAFPALQAHAETAETRSEVQQIAVEEELGARLFTAPPAAPPILFR